MRVPPLRLGIVGCGSLTERGLLPHLRLEPSSVTVTALCDVSQTRLEHLANRFGIKGRFTDYSELLAHEEIDAVAIATPIQLHYEQAQEALTAGRHVYVQKTMAGTGKEARHLMRLAEERELTLAASPGQMGLPAYARALDVVDEGRLGKALMAIGVTLARGHEYETVRSGGDLDPGWYYSEGAGPLRDMGVYALHAIAGILGPVQAVTALGTRPSETRRWGGSQLPAEVNEGVVITLDLSGGALGAVVAGYTMAPGYLEWGHLAISGTEGALEVRRPSGSPSRYEVILQTVELGTPTRESYGTGLPRGHDALEEAHVARDVLDFVVAVRDARPPLAHPADACHVIDVIEAAEAAVAKAERRSVPRPPPRPG